MGTFITWLGQYKDGADILIKLFGVAVVLIGGIRFFLDRRDARRATELAMRRDAYFGLFSALPLQQAALGAFFNAGSAPFVMPPEGTTALPKLHLLASEEALRCIISRNAIFHKAVIDLATMKNHALELESQTAALNNTSAFLDVEESTETPEQRAAHLKVTDKQRRQLLIQRIAAWEAFIEIFMNTLVELGNNYRELLPLARRDIGLGDSIDPILAALSKDQDAALEAFGRTVEGFRQQHALRPKR